MKFSMCIIHFPSISSTLFPVKWVPEPRLNLIERNLHYKKKTFLDDLIKDSIPPSYHYSDYSPWLNYLNENYLFLIKNKMTGTQTDIPLSSRGFGAFLIPEGWLSGLLSCKSSFPGWVCPRETTPKNRFTNTNYKVEFHFLHLLLFLIPLGIF